MNGDRRLAELRNLSAILLAGGKSTRMGSEKAFLKLIEQPYISIMSKELSKVCDDIVVTVGRKRTGKFESVLSPSVRILKDRQNYGSPVCGISTGLNLVRNPLTAIVACDLPLIKHEIIDFLHRRCIGHSAAVPIWPNGDIEPLCGVYDVEQTKAALVSAHSRFGKIGPRHLINQMEDVCFVPVSQLKAYDKYLGSLVNVNTPKDYSELSNLMARRTQQRPRIRA